MDSSLRQRGYFSEYIAPDVSVEVQHDMKEGPADTSIFRVNSKQKIPRALNPMKVLQTGVDLSKTKSRVAGGTMTLQEATHSQTNLSAPQVEKSAILEVSMKKSGLKGNGIMANSRILHPERPISTVGLYSGQIEGVADAEPKVFEPIEPIPGRVPRKVEIDRKKKLYKRNKLEELFAAEGLDKDQEPSYLSWLPLELFDDETFDDYTPQEWMQKVQNGEDGKPLGLAGRGCQVEMVEGKPKHVWRDVLVYSYYEPEKEFVCNFYDRLADPGRKIGDKVRFKRIDLWFELEDPVRFVHRVMKAHELRKVADSKVRYNYYIDSMQKVDVNAMETEQKNRLYTNAKDVKSLKSQKGSQTTYDETLKSEAADEYQRTMNKIIFNEYFEEANPDLYAPFDVKVPEEPVKKVPYFGIIEIPRREVAEVHDDKGFEYPATKSFSANFKQFIFESHFIKKEVIMVLQEIKSSCKEVANKELFHINFKETERIEGFRQKQGGQISLLATYLKEGWINELSQMIKTRFAGIGKGWFSIEGVKMMTHDQSKLKRFLTTVRLMMQDTMYTMLHRGLFEFRDYLKSFIPDKVAIHSLNHIDNDFDPSKTMQRFKNNKHNALIKIDLIRVSGLSEFNYSIRPAKIVEEVLNLFAKSLEEMEKIPDLEPKILENLFKARKTATHILTPQLPKSPPIIPDPNEIPKRYPDENKWVWDLKEELKGIMEKAVEPLRHYTEQFDKYKELININPDEYINKLENEESSKSAEGLQSEIDKWAEAEARVKQEIPEEVVVSCFLIDCRELIRFLTGKYQDMNKRLLELMARKARDKINTNRKKIQEILKRIRANPTNIEELTALNDFTKNDLPGILNQIRNETGVVSKIHDILESYQYYIAKDDQIKKWEIFKGPLEIEEAFEDRERELGKFKDEFEEEMDEEQVAFQKMIKQKEDAIARLHESNKEDKIEEYAENMESFKKVLEKMREQAELFNKREVQFGKPDQTDYSKINQLIEDLTPYYNLWIQINTWRKNGDKWMKDPWKNVDALKAENFVDQGYQTLIRSVKTFNPNDPNFTDLIAVAEKTKSEIEKFKPKVPLLVSLKREGMADRHWAEISKEVGKEINPNKEITNAAGKKAVFNLDYLINEGLMNKMQICINVGEKAYKEFEIERDLKTMKAIWDTTDFTLVPHHQTYLISNFEEIENLADEHLSRTQNLLINPYKEFFAKDIEEWNTKLVLISDTLEEWSKLQRNWKYLSPIFESGDIVKQMPTESTNFKRVDSNWKHTMNRTKALTNVKKACTDDPILEKSKESNRALEQIQLKLKDYLEKKRSVFGRFYFLSDDDLLSILSQTKDVERVQDHLRKVFESIALLDFDANKKIIAMNSVEKEKIKFTRIVDPTLKQVEDWMSEVEREMKRTVRDRLALSILQYPDAFTSNADRNAWVLSHPGQCVLNGSQVKWTREVETAILAKNVDAYCKEMNTQLNKLIKIERGELSKNQLITIEALIVIDVHALDITEKLRSIDNLEKYEWISQLRYYWVMQDKEENCITRCVQTEYPYGYEYLGNSNRLVITPLTDRCYITLMGALNLNLGGAPAGPAGTGKTESTKDLAKALAKQCVVFNCQESMGYQFVGKFFKGLASSGAWCCFDEFNRINLEVLSVIAQQLQELFTAKAKKATNISFEGSEIKLQGSFCVFITMNPGYAGRTELPDNLKALFRPVAMMVPDYAMISEIKLFSFGFSKEMGRELAKKLVATFRLSSEQLSSQFHYDYGMRAVTSVINAAGLLKRNPAMAALTEDQLILKAIRDVNVPKFLKDDLPLFQYIIKDLFPDTPEPKDNYGSLGQAIAAVADDKENPVQTTPAFTTKVYQLYDTIQVRHGLMLVGPTGGGKTTNWKILQKALTYIARVLKSNEQTAVNVEILNPKSITMAQLYGEYKEMNWQEGIIEKIAEKAISNQYNKEKGTEKYWIMFDGPVDALWIESMNTVLDDNKKLCLSSGKVMILTSFITMMFEVEDLAVASPATVSRCGMVYMEPQSLGVDPLIQSFLKRLPPTLTDQKGDWMSRLRALFALFVPDGIKFLRTQVKEILDTFDNNIVGSLLRLLWVQFRNYFEVDGVKKKPADMERANLTLENLFIFCFIWSFCSTGDAESRDKFNIFVRDKIKALNHPNVTFPEDRTVFDHEFFFMENKWRDWNEKFKEYAVPAKSTFSDIVVPTLDYCRLRSLLGYGLTNKLHMLVVGGTGTGKSVGALKFLGDGLSDRFTSMSLVLSAQTSSIQLQDTIYQQLGKRKKGVYGPDGGRSMICLVDDLNMPKKETYGAQPPIELLRQYLDHKAWYIIQANKEYTVIEDVVLLGAMGPPGGGRTKITDRLLRHFNITCLTEMTDDQMQYIFKVILSAMLNRLQEEPRALIDVLISSTIQVYNKVRKDLKPIPSKTHYTFNLRDIAKILQGVSIVAQQTIKTPVALARLWYHENMRVFHDRLTTEDDRVYLKSLLSNTSLNFGAGVTPETLFENDEKQIETILFCDFMYSNYSDNPDYVLVEDFKTLEKILEKYQTNHNDMCKPKDKLNLVMFSDACEHVARITRVLRQPQGSVLLLGVGGSGRQSLTRLAVFIRGMDLKSINIVKGYNMVRWREDLKNVLSNIIENNKPMCFMFVDTQIIDEQMVEDINCLLNSGWVVGLPFNEDEMNKLDDIGRRICTEKKLAASKINLYSCQVDRIKKNLHISFAMSPLSDAFLTRMRMFPSFVNCCTIDWFTEWPEDALRRVGIKEMSADAENLGIADMLPKVVEMFKAMHKSVEKMTNRYRTEVNRHNYVTPRSYLELLTLFRKVLLEKSDKSKNDIKRLENGIQMLADADKDVAELNKVLTEKRPQLEKKTKEIQAAMGELAIQSEAVTKKNEIVTKEAAIANEEAMRAKELEVKVTAAFQSGQLELDAALKELDNFDSKNLSEMQKYPSPNDVLKQLALAVNTLLEKNMASLKLYINPAKNPSEMDNFNWAEFKKKASKANAMLVEMKDLVKQFGQKEKFLALRNYIEADPLIKQNWNFKYWDGKSQAAGHLWKFINAMLNGFALSVELEPLREQKARADEQVQRSEKEVALKRAELKEIMDKMAQLSEAVKTQQMELNILQETITSNEKKLQRASSLTILLKDENKRWVEDVKKFTQEIQFIAGHCLISSGMVCYSGPFTEEYRNQLESSWFTELDNIGIPYLPGTTMKKYLEDPVKVMDWNVWGLPKDATSIQNGVILEYSQRWPLMIDPQTQANKYLKRRIKDKNEHFDIVKASIPNLMKVIETGIHFGKVILLENVGIKLDPALEPVLMKQVTFDKSTRALTISLGDRSITYSEKFHLYMTTTNPNPHYSPEMCAKVTIINFGITNTGLIEQMLAAIIILENRKLEDSKNEIVKSNAEDNRELRTLEDRILTSLSESQGRILEDDSIIDQLRTATNKSKMIMQRVSESLVTERQIDESRGYYRPVAKRTSVLFFCIVDLANIDPMYQYSLQWYENLFKMSVDNTPASKQLDERLSNLKKYFTEALYRNVCRSLFGRHKLLFSFLMATRLLAEEGVKDTTFDKHAYQHLLTGSAVEVKVPPKAADWINSDSTWKQIYTEMSGLEYLKQFEGILKHFMTNLDEWKPIYDSLDPVKEPLPAEWDGKLDLFDKILIIKAIRPDKVTVAVQDYVEKKLGKYYIEIPIVKLEECFEDSSCSIPLIFILSQGSDPKADFDTFVASKKITDVKSISLGQGQGEKATAMIQRSKPEGGWVLLQNCHLSASWMSELEALVESLTEPGVHKDFRLWLTSMPSGDFPISILQNSVKMTIEPPQGIKDNLKKSYGAMPKSEQDEFKDYSDSFKKLLYGLSFFHAIIQDRRKFGAIGWNIPYEFTFEDLDVCKKQLRIFLSKQNDIPYEVIKTVCADINYGGRVTDKKDGRLIQSIINKFINEDIVRGTCDFGEEAYAVPSKAVTFTDYLEHINKFPMHANPEVFGLHPNAAITYAQNQTRSLLENLVSIQPKDGGSNSDSRNTTILTITKLVESRTPKVFNLEEVKAQYPPDDYNESMNTVLVQELIRCNRLLELMAVRLQDLKLAINGEVVMSEELEKIAFAFFIQQVPAEWSYPLGFLSLKPLNAWTEELNQRVDFFQSWITNGQPTCFWLGGFFFPQAFITGTQQNYARKVGVSIDQLNFEYELLRYDQTPATIKERPETGVYVHGIYIEGARWDGSMKYLNHSRPKELFSELPVLVLKPLIGEENQVSSGANLRPECTHVHYIRCYLEQVP